MNYKDYTQRSYLVAFLTIVIGFVLFLLNSLSFSTGIRKTISFVYEPLTFYADSVGENFRGFISIFGEIGELRDKNADLEKRNAKLIAENASVRELLEERLSLLAQLNLGNENEKVLEAKAVFAGNGEAVNTLLLNVGEKDGVSKGDVVVIGNLFIGIISDLSLNGAKVRLPTNNASHIEVLVVESIVEGFTVEELTKKYGTDETIQSLDIARGVATGSLSGIKIENLPSTESLKPKSSVLVNDAKVGKILYLGEVDRVERDPAAASATAWIKTPLNFNGLHTVFVIID